MQKALVHTSGSSGGKTSSAFHPSSRRPLLSSNRTLLHRTGKPRTPSKTSPLVCNSLQTFSKSIDAEAFEEPDVLAELPLNLRQIVEAFRPMPDNLAKFKELLKFASQMDPLPERDHTNDNRVHGCVVQVWVKGSLNEGLVYFQAYSDAQLTKGLAALLVKGLSGSTPEQILQIRPDFIEILCRKQSMTRSRSNGFLNMFRLMQQQALQLAVLHLQQQEEELLPSYVESLNAENSIVSYDRDSVLKIA